MPPTQETQPRTATVRVILCVRGGVAETILKPKGIEVLIFDYNVDGTDPVDRDPDGNPCCIQTLSSHEKVTANKHWPIVRTAARKLNGHHAHHAHHAQQRWWCPQCRRTVHSNSESLAEAGTPYCPQCDRDMEMM